MNDEFQFSLEDMLAWCEPEHAIKGYGPDEIRKAIAAALKAGQVMYKDLDDNEAGYTAGQAAWDAATKEDV